MAEMSTNGTEPATADVEMKEEGSTEASMLNIAQAETPIAQPSQTLQTQIPPELPFIAEQVAAATPPATSGASARPGSMPPQPSARPEKPVAHGGPTRQYLNANITPHLLEGMKYLAVYEPEKPLQWLSEFLRDRSKEVEG